MEIRRVRSQSSTTGSADWFTGTVRIDPLFEAPEPAQLTGLPGQCGLIRCLKLRSRHVCVVQASRSSRVHALRGIHIRSVRR